MSEVKKKCKYKHWPTGWECPYNALENSKDGFCIFHERRKDKDINWFNEGIKKILEDKDSDAYHFEGFFFPCDPVFELEEFTKSVFFMDARFVGESMEFTGMKFAGDVNDFRGAVFIGDVLFDHTHFFGKQTSFFQAEFSGKLTSFFGAKFTGEETDFQQAKFPRQETSFMACEFLAKHTDFRGARFQSEETDFSLVGFLGEEADFSHARFSGNEVFFYYTQFPQKILFMRTLFDAKTTFTRVDLRNCAFIEVDLTRVNFSLISWQQKGKLLNETHPSLLRDRADIGKVEVYQSTEEVYRQLKVQFQQKRDVAMAGFFHHRERECERKTRRLPKDFVHWFSLWILKLSCGYGEKLQNVLISSVALILIFGIVYMFLGLHAADQAESLIFQYKLTLENPVPIGKIISDYLTSVSFSLKGFFPLWRFQQYKLIGDFANLVAGIEFLLGLFFVGLFIYVFRRRMEK